MEAAPMAGRGESDACAIRSEEHTSELQSLRHLVCRLLLEKKKSIDQELIPTYLDNGITSRFADDSLGNRTSNPIQTFIYTLNGSAMASYGRRPEVLVSTTI